MLPFLSIIMIATASSKFQSALANGTPLGQFAKCSESRDSLEACYLQPVLHYHSGQGANALVVVRIWPALCVQLCENFPFLRTVRHDRELTANGDDHAHPLSLLAQLDGAEVSLRHFLSPNVSTVLLEDGR